MEINLKNHQKKVRLNSPQILKITKIILKVQGIRQALLSIVFVSHQKIRALNKKFLNRDYGTDVLAFDLSEHGPSKRKSTSVTGDIIISTDAAIQNTKAFDVPLTQEITLYVIHGILHLCGYDDHKPRDIKKMRKREQEILICLGKKINRVVR